MTETSAWLNEFVVAAADPARVRAFVAQVMAAIVREQPEVLAEPGMAAEVESSVRAHWRGFLSVLGGTSFEPRVPAEARDLVRSLVLRGHELDVQVGMYRAGQRAVWRYITDLVETGIADEALRAAVLVAFWERASQWLDTSTEAVIATVVAERAALLRGADERRTALVHELLRGGGDADADSAALGYRLRGSHRCHIVWAPGPAADLAGGPDAGLLDAGIEALVRAPGVVGRLVLRRGDREAWCWVAVETTPPDGTTVAGGTATLPRGLRVATGTVGAGTEGFARSHREALAAYEVARAATAAAARPATGYRDVELACLAAGLTDRADVVHFVDRELGALTGTDEATVRLRATLLGYLDGDANTDAAASALNVHPNTVRYRVRQAEQLIGHPIDRRRGHLELALRVLDAFGDTAAIPSAVPHARAS